MLPVLPLIYQNETIMKTTKNIVKFENGIWFNPSESTNNNGYFGNYWESKQIAHEQHFGGVHSYNEVGHYFLEAIYDGITYYRVQASNVWN